MSLYSMTRGQYSILLLCILSITVTLVRYCSHIKNDLDVFESKNIQRKLDSSDIFFQYKCLVNVHGIHHSGTGYLRYMIVNALGGSSLVSEHKNTNVPEDEGHHLQSAYPDFLNRVRNPKLCISEKYASKNKGKLYYCPKLLNTVVNEENKISLFDDWSKNWDMTKPFLIQKTPTMDILLLEHLKITPTFHAIVMRHPFHWHLNDVKNTDKPIIWLDVWANVLEQLLEGNIENFAVVNYELLVLAPDAVSKNLQDMILDSCSVQTSNQRRQLHMHNDVDSHKYIRPIHKEMMTWNECRQNKDCKSFMLELAPIISQFGYSFHANKLYQRSKTGRNILFSSQNLPDLNLVKKMKNLAMKYTQPSRTLVSEPLETVLSLDYNKR